MVAMPNLTMDDGQTDKLPARQIDRCGAYGKQHHRDSQGDSCQHGQTNDE